MHLFCIACVTSCKCGKISDTVPISDAVPISSSIDPLQPQLSLHILFGGYKIYNQIPIIEIPLKT